MIKLDLPSLQVRPLPPFRGKEATLGQGLRAGAVMALFFVLVVGLWRLPVRAEPVQAPHVHSAIGH